MKNKFSKGQGCAMLLVIVLILGGLAYYASIILSSTGIGEDMSIKLGLDLAGGVSITYQVDEDDFTDEEVSDTIYKLQQRVEAYSTEAVVYREGDDRITVEIPGVTDANAILEELGKPGSLEFQTPDGEAFLTGDMIEDAQAGSYSNDMGNNEFVVDLTFTSEGAEIFGEVTSANVGNTLPIVYDGEVISSPEVQQAITGGTAQITKIGSFEEAEILASNIRIGSLSLQLSELRSNVVGAQLGSDAISSSLKAAAIGLIIVMLFMMIVYFVPGVAASVALAIYTCLVIATLYLFEITLTLPGIAGIILSIGMAVDANVIIFARIREEISSGKSVGSSINMGFKQALSRAPHDSGVDCGTAVAATSMADQSAERYNPDCGGCVISVWLRLSKGLCQHIGNWYHSFHVYSAGDYKIDFKCIICTGLAGCEVFWKGKSLKYTASCGKKNDFIRHFYCYYCSRIYFHGRLWVQWQRIELQS